VIHNLLGLFVAGVLPRRLFVFAVQFVIALCPVALVIVEDFLPILNCQRFAAVVVLNELVAPTRALAIGSPAGHVVAVFVLPAVNFPGVLGGPRVRNE